MPTTAPRQRIPTARRRRAPGSATNNGFGADIARASAPARRAGRSELYEDWLSRRLVGEPDAPLRPLREPRGGESGGKRPERAHGHDLWERGRSRRGRRLVSAQRRRFPATGGMARRLGAAARPVGFEGKSAAGSAGIGRPEGLIDCPLAMARRPYDYRLVPPSSSASRPQARVGEDSNVYSR